MKTHIKPEVKAWTRRRWLGTGAAGLASFVTVAPVRAALGRSYAEKVLAKNPVAYWRLGEASGATAMDATKHGHDGAYHGTPILGQPGAIRSEKDTAVQLDGKQSYVEIPDHPDFSQPTSSKGMTVEVWMRPDVLEFPGETEDPYVMWLGKGQKGQDEWGLRFYSRKSTRPNRISAYIFNPGGGLGSGAYFEDKLNAGEWIHIVAAYSPGDTKKPTAGVSIYKNGKLRTGPTVPGATGTLYRAYNIVPAHGNMPLRLGSMNLKSFLTGALDEVAIYPHALTAAEILDHYTTGMRKA
jgi:hypothetical protein